VRRSDGDQHEQRLHALRTRPPKPRRRARDLRPSRIDTITTKSPRARRF
jgi:hypothetical protein